METDNLVVKHHELKVSVDKEPGGDLLAFLEGTVLGTPGGIRYKHTQTAEKLRNLGKPFFLILRKSEKILGSVGLCSRETNYSDRKFTSWYVRYFAIKAPLKSLKPRKEKLFENSGRGMSLLRKTASPYLERPGELLTGLAEGTEKSLVYAYIEQANFQSVQFANQNGFETVRNFTTFMFSRFLPKRNSHVVRLSKNEEEEVRKKLGHFYKDHTLYMEDNLFYRNDYLVYKTDGKIVAGLQANPDMWIVKDMPGISGKLLVNFLPFIPLFNRIFNARKLKFIAADYIFWEEGYEHILNDLLEGACKMNKTHLLITWSDTGSKVLKTLDSAVDAGMIGRGIKRVEVDVKVKFNGWEQEEKELFYKNPTFISAFDAT
ncbi:MAG: hypothetical protein H6539_08315 [Bacteroidales bacterium]|nr:hypothetical protein [Bacteroidales bacterium]